MTHEDPDIAHHRDLENNVWAALVSDPAVGVAVIDENGLILTANHRIADLFLGTKPEDGVGKRLDELFSEEWAAERLEVYHQILRSGKPAIVRHIRRGRQLQSTVRPLDTPEGKPRRLLTLTHVGEFVQPDEEEHFEVVESSIADWGPLDVLTRRELEVLALIKLGMTTNDIASMLFRSPKTIENHRQSIGKKLGVQSRVVLAQIAEKAGLELADAELDRTSKSK